MIIHTNLMNEYRDGIYERTFTQFLKSYMGQGRIRGIEIGVLEGRNAIAMLRACPNIAELTLIDPYLSYSGYCGRRSKSQQVSLDTAKSTMHKNTLPYRDRVHYILEKSSNAVGQLHGLYDFVYIDGNHSKEYVLSDISLYLPFIKPLGIIGGNDFLLSGDQKYMEVGGAVRELCERVQLDIYVGGDEYADWWFINPGNLRVINGECRKC